MAQVPTIEIDWTAISSQDDFYRKLLEQLDAPDWHGRNLNALWDSIGAGEINGIEPPYRIVFSNSHAIAAPLVEFARSVMLVLFDSAMSRPGIELVVKATGLPHPSEGRPDSDPESARVHDPGTVDFSAD